MKKKEWIKTIVFIAGFFLILIPVSYTHLRPPHFMSLMFRISAQPFLQARAASRWLWMDGFVQHDAYAAHFAADIGGTFKIPVGEALFYRFDACFFKFLDGVDGVAGAVALVLSLIHI